MQSGGFVSYLRHRMVNGYGNDKLYCWLCKSSMPNLLGCSDWLLFETYEEKDKAGEIE